MVLRANPKQFAFSILLINHQRNPREQISGFYAEFLEQALTQIPLGFLTPLERIYLYSLDGVPVLETDGAGKWVQENIRADGQFLAEYTGNETYFRHSDHLGL
jgi:hypothetical protein